MKIIAFTSCEVHGEIRFLYVKAIQIHHELCQVYELIVITDAEVRQWCWNFKSGYTNVHDEQLNGRASILTNEIMQQVNQKLRSDRRLRFSVLSHEFFHVERTIFYAIVMEKFLYHKLYTAWVSNVLTNHHNGQIILSGRAFLDRYW